MRACGAVGSALEWHSRGHGFEPRQVQGAFARPYKADIVFSVSVLFFVYKKANFFLSLINTLL